MLKMFKRTHTHELVWSLLSRLFSRAGTEPLNHFSFQAQGAMPQRGLDFLLHHARGNAETLGYFQVRRFIQARSYENPATPRWQFIQGLEKALPLLLRPHPTGRIHRFLRYIQHIKTERR